MAKSTASVHPGVPTVRELIAELAQLEDAIRRIPTFVANEDGPVLNPELMALVARERKVVAELRARRIR